MSHTYSSTPKEQNQFSPDNSQTLLCAVLYTVRTIFFLYNDREKNVHLQAMIFNFTPQPIKIKLIITCCQ